MSQKFIFGKKYRSLKGSGPIFGRQTPKLGFHAASRVWLKVKDARWQIERERSRATARAADPGDFE